ncbi:MAG: hypothetical protein LBH05_00815 [Deferribacteraceae bacterium]|jgi:hypothetical protein|nr:hypothetical protein [Deferribacteraceae bacterium]
MQERLSKVKTKEELDQFKSDHSQTFKDRAKTSSDTDPNTCFIPKGESLEAQKVIMRDYLGTVGVLASENLTIPSMQIATMNNTNRDGLQFEAKKQIFELMKDNKTGGLYNNIIQSIMLRKEEQGGETASYKSGYFSSKHNNRTLLHEMGHSFNTDFTVTYKGNKMDLDSVLIKYKNDVEKGISKYALVDKGELIAESFARYIGWKYGKGKLKDNEPSELNKAIIQGIYDARKVSKT